MHRPTSCYMTRQFSETMSKSQHEQYELYIRLTLMKLLPNVKYVDCSSGTSKTHQIRLFLTECIRS